MQILTKLEIIYIFLYVLNTLLTFNDGHKF